LEKAFRFDITDASMYFHLDMNGKSIKIYTIGYQGMMIDYFIKTLHDNEINIIVDIREKPFSRIKDFSRKNLSNHLVNSNIEYIHLGELGSPQNLRDKVKADHDYSYFFEHYKIYLNTQIEVLAALYNLLIDKTVCLLCFEKDWQTCHRKIVAETLAGFKNNGAGIQIVNL